MRKQRFFYFSLFTLILATTSCRKYQDFPASEQDPRLSGGSQTTFDQGSGAFDHSFDGLSVHDQLIHDIGDKEFSLAFVTSPAPVNPGLGPLYNNISCGSCHQSQGPGAPPTPGQPAGLEALLLRISYGTDQHGGPGLVPDFGGQLQNNAVYGAQKEADYTFTYTTQTVVYPDGDSVQLKAPVYTIYNSYTSLPSGMMVSPRIPPEVFGMGLLENVGDATIIAMANEGVSNPAVIPGHPNYVWDVIKQQMVVGRFGHKAERPDLAQQIGIALNEDIGITNKIFPTESCYGQTQYASSNSKGTEISDSLFNCLVYYLKTIQVPARRNVTNPIVLRGQQLFNQAKCSGCHRETLVTDVNVAFPQVSNQTIHPYTDLLLHDLGTGLADNRPVYNASGSEFRTCPLWGIGLTQVVTGQTSFLHDGRASTLEQAILWHGGEASFSRNFFTNLSKDDRTALIAFLNSL
ncbi:MAG TPA: di-heme oxidoredictase family protein [Bacteroidia bacterium]|nr:di-heme oxidoredictase family protein [Bacteroidia bacterium]